MNGLRGLFALPVIGYALRALALAARLPTHLDGLTSELNAYKVDAGQDARTRLTERQSRRDAELTLGAEVAALRKRVERLEQLRAKDAVERSATQRASAIDAGQPS